MYDRKLYHRRISCKVHFDHFQDQTFWYTTYDGWLYPIHYLDTVDVNGSPLVMEAEDNGLVHSRWIRYWMENEPTAPPLPDLNISPKVA